MDDVEPVRLGHAGAQSSMKRNRSESVRSVFLRISRARVSPWMYSMTMNGCESNSPKS